MVPAFRLRWQTLAIQEEDGSLLRAPRLRGATSIIYVSARFVSGLEGHQHEAHTVGTAYPRGTYASVHTQTHPRLLFYLHIPCCRRQHTLRCVDRRRDKDELCMHARWNHPLPETRTPATRARPSRRPGQPRARASNRPLALERSPPLERSRVRVRDSSPPSSHRCTWRASRRRGRSSGPVRSEHMLRAAAAQGETRRPGSGRALLPIYKLTGYAFRN